MNGELVKRQDRWDLYAEDGSKIGSSAPNPMNKLSLKNCQAIENDYDLMKLAEENSHKYYDVKTTDWHCNYNGFFSGFQKALEILDGKKFSEKDIRRALSAGLSIGYGRQFEIENKQVEIDSYIKSLQQTEWLVEIEMEESCPYDYTSRCTQGRCDCKKPKLDAGGCLILKIK